MAQIDVRATREDEDGFEFSVSVEEAGSPSAHQVTLSRDDYQRWGSDSPSPEGFIRRCFEFLLEREPKESILSRFDVSQIRRYFPEFDEQIGKLQG